MARMTGVLFDLDGTLLDTLEDLWRATDYALRQFGCPPRTRAEVRRFVGDGVGKLIERALPGAPDDPDAEAVLRVFREYYGAHGLDNTRPYPGICAALGVLRAAHPVAVVSNKPDAMVKRLTETFFGEVYALGERGGVPRKPAPDMLFAAAGAIGADRWIYVGDSEVDIATARGAGMPCLSALWGFRDYEALAAAGATHFCPAPERLPACIAAMEEEYGK